MLFRQLLEPVSSTCTYVLGCPHTGDAILIDPVVNSMGRDLQVLQGRPASGVHALTPTFTPTTSLRHWS